MKKKRRTVQVKMPEKAYLELEAVRHEAGLSTMSEVIRFSITLFKWTVDRQKQGYVIYAIPAADEQLKGGERVQMLLPV